MVNQREIIDSVFYDAKYAIKRMPVADLCCTGDISGSKGVQFWKDIAAQCDELAVRYPRQVKYIATLYDKLWKVWKYYRDVKE